MIQNAILHIYYNLLIFYKKTWYFSRKNVILKYNRAAIKKEKTIYNAQTINFCNEHKEQNSFKIQIYICVEIFLYTHIKFKLKIYIIGRVVPL